MGRTKSPQRETFEKDTFPHLEALQRTAQWLTMRRSHAEELVLKTMTQAYRSWHGSINTAGGKARLFRILVGEFYDNGNRRHQTGRSLQERREVAGGSGKEGRQYPNASVDRWELLPVTRISGVFVKGAIARLEPQSRLIMILLFHEHFSHAEIAHITGLRKDSVKLILARFRRKIPLDLAQHAGSFLAEGDSRAKIRLCTGSSAMEKKLGPCVQPDSPAVNRESEGGTLDSQY